MGSDNCNIEDMAEKSIACHTRGPMKNILLNVGGNIFR